MFSLFFIVFFPFLPLFFSLSFLDFNRKAATEKTKQYQKEYMQNMEHGYKGKPAAKQQTQPKKQAKKETAKPSPKGTWKNTDG